MSWLSDWISSWFNNWFGSGQQNQTTSATRFGRIVKTGDILFADSSCIVSSGVVLGRQSGDDYVRFRVPDTNCPALPEPTAPLDSGLADEAEPNRWMVTGTPDTSNGWTMLQSRDIILLAYSCYDSDFLLEYTASVPGWTGTQNGAYFDGVGLEFQRDANNYVNVAIGLTPGERGWGIRAVINGVESKSIGPAVLSDVTFKAQVQRSGSNWSARFWRSDTAEWSSWASIGAVGSGLVTIRLVGLRFNLVPYGSSSRDVTVRFTNITTLSGTPSSVTVATPVVDLQKSVKCTVQRVPSLGTLEWRASDTPFQQTDTLPAWSSPEGAYRYWQARVTWTDANQLLERVEFLSEAQPLALFRRFRDYWTLWDTSQGKSIRTDDIGVLASGVQSRTADGVEVGDEERVTTIR